MPTIKELIDGKMTELMQFIDENKASAIEEDQWMTFNPNIELQFSINDDDRSTNFERMEVWAYSATPEQINTDDYILITSYEC